MSDLGSFQSRAALRDRMRKAKRERRHSIGGLEPHIRRELSLQINKSNNNNSVNNIVRSSSYENLPCHHPTRHTSPVTRGGKKGKLLVGGVPISTNQIGERNISVTSLGSHISDVNSPFLNFRKHLQTSSIGSGMTNSVGSVDSCSSSILTTDQSVSVQQQGRRETLNLMARIAAKNSFSGHNYLQGLKYEVEDSSNLYSSGSTSREGGENGPSCRGCCKFWSYLPIANPTSLWRILWDTHLTVLLVYIAIVVPYYIGFGGTQSRNSFLKTFETYIDVAFIIDIVLSFLTGYTNDEGQIVKNHYLIARRYIATYLWIDIVSAIPWEFVGGMNSEITNIFKLTKISKAARSLQMLKMANTARLRFIGAIFDEFFAMHHNVRKIVSTILVVSFLIHLNACAFGWICGVGGESSWLAVASLDDASSFETYVSALYWSVTTITTVGYGDIVPITPYEKIFVIFSVAVGAVTYGSVISTFVAASAASNLKKSQMQSRLDAIVRYMKERKYPKPLFKKVFNYFRHFYERVALDESSILNDLSENLRVEVATYMSWRAFRGNDLFKTVEIKYLTVILLLTKPVRRGMDEYLYRAGDVGLEMYIVTSGTLEVRREGNEKNVVTTIKRHGNVGEMCAFGLRDRRSFTVMATETTEMMSLSKESILNQLASLCPEVVEDLRRIVNTKYRRLRKLLKGKDVKDLSSKKSSSGVSILETILSTSSLVSTDKNISTSAKVAPETIKSKRGDICVLPDQDSCVSNQEEEGEEEGEEEEEMSEIEDESYVSRGPAVEEEEEEEKEEEEPSTNVKLDKHEEILSERVRIQQKQYENLSSKVDEMYLLLQKIAKNTQTPLCSTVCKDR